MHRLLNIRSLVRSLLSEGEDVRLIGRQTAAVTSSIHTPPPVLHNQKGGGGGTWSMKVGNNCGTSCYFIPPAAFDTNLRITAAPNFGSFSKAASHRKLIKE